MALGAGLAGLGLGWLSRRDHARALARLDGFDVQSVDAPFGRIEYTEWGSGKPILMIHGVVGGWDGAASWRRFTPPNHRVVTPARFGYLGSSMPTRATPAMQADAYVDLLDALRIDRLPVIGFSAGSTSAVRLVLQHPGRVERLVLICPNAPHPYPAKLPPKVLGPLIFSQPVFWALRRFGRRALRRIAGFPADFGWDAEARLDEREIFDSFYPVGRRTAGIVFDTYESNPDIANCALEKIAVPTLVVHARDDPLAPYEDSRQMAARIPDARFITVPCGGHVFMHRDQAIRTEVHRFLDPGPASGREATHPDSGEPRHRSRASGGVRGEPWR